MNKLKFTSIVILVILSSIESKYVNAQVATVSIDRNWEIRNIPESLYGFNGEIWDSNQDGSNIKYNNLLKNAGIKVMRWPGGSWGDIIKWDSTKCYASYAVTYAQSKALYNNLGIKFQPIGNFSGMFCNVQHTSIYADSVAASWVADSALGAQYWEVGNESMGSWEQGHTIGSDYGNRFADFYTSMKAVNNKIKIIAVGDQNDEDDSKNPGTGVWNRKLMQAALKKGVVPDGFQIHNYPGAEGNYGMLHHNLDEIAKFTKDLNYMVSSETGRGQLDYCMTEFSASGNNRWLKMIGAQLSLQYFMEMAKYNWAVANVWGEIYNTGTFVAAPVWYVYAFLESKFGRNMVHATSDNIDVRAYASIDTSKYLTFWVCNNSLDSSKIKIKLSNFIPASKGEIWVVQGSGGLGEESYDVMINGVGHPAEINARFMPGVQIDVDTSFVLDLPASSFALLKLTPANQSSCEPTEIIPEMKIDSEDWEPNIYAAVGLGHNISISPTASGTGSWRWSGPDSFVDSVQNIKLDSLQVSGKYIVSYTNECGTTSKKSFDISVIDSTKCEPTYVVPYFQVQANPLTWESSTSITMESGKSVKFGPQPFTGSWNWSGPNGNLGNTREITVPNIQSSGTYTLVYTNACGTITTQIYTVTVKPVSGVPNQEIINDLSIYPSPSRNGFIKIKSDDIISNVDLAIFNLQGIEVFTQKNLNSEKMINTGLQPGIYIVSVNYKNNKFISKLIIE